MSDMTSAVAIDLLDNLIGMIEDNQENDYDEAFRMAINALKAQHETHEKRTETHACDCISRQAAIDAVDDVPYIKDHPNIGLLWKAWVEQLPPAQPEPYQAERRTDGIR